LLIAWIRQIGHRIEERDGHVRATTGVGGVRWRNRPRPWDAGGVGALINLITVAGNDRGHGVYNRDDIGAVGVIAYAIHRVPGNRYGLHAWAEDVCDRIEHRYEDIRPATRINRSWTNRHPG
jgi:hypothetical protein